MSKEKTVIVNNKKTGLIGFESVTLMPGANEVAEAIAKTMMEHPIIKIMIGEGTLEFLSNEKEEFDLEKLSNGDAIALVKSTVFEDLLKDWKKLEKRKPVLKAIDEQLALLEAPIEYKDGKKA